MSAGPGDEARALRIGALNVMNGTIRRSTIYLAIGKEMKVYRSAQEIPAAVRRKLTESTSRWNSATILIADKRGREELSRAMSGKESPFGSRAGTSPLVQKLVTPAEAPGPTVPAWVRWMEAHAWTAVGMTALLGAVAWLLLLLR